MQFKACDNSMTECLHYKQLFGFSDGHGLGAPDGEMLAYAQARAGNTRIRPEDMAPRDCFARAPHFYDTDELLVAIEGNPHWRGPGPAAGPAAESAVASSTVVPNVASRVAYGYRELGTRFLERLHGGFALALIDRRLNVTVLAVDRMGIERLAFAVTAEAIVFGSSPDAVARFPSFVPRLRPQALFDFLLMHMVPSPDSVYESVQKLRAGTYARFQQGRIETAAYWQPVFAESSSWNMDAMGSELRAALSQAVARCSPDEHTGAFLSGGLDSSTVAGTLAAQLSRPASTFSIGFGVEGYDELEYARIASRRFGTIAHEYKVTPEDVVVAIPRIAAAYDEPFGNSSAVPTYFCAQLARQHGIGHLLAGDGGDEIFGGNQRYAQQKIFEAYWRIPPVIRQRIIEPISRFIDPETPFTPARKLRSYVDQARIPMPERLEWWNFMYRADLGTMLEPSLREAIDPRFALRRMAEVYALAPANSLVNRMLFYDWQYTLADNDLRKVGTMCELSGVRVSYPMLDQRVVETSLRVPPNQKVAGLNLRAFFKRSMSDFLPPEIIEKKKHGFGLPFGVWLKTHRPLAELIYSSLSDLKHRHIIRPAFLDELIEDHRKGHPSYFGYAIWDLTMLEAWLASHVGRC
jgi:asparagine synthase (glutamine-hydrolysing)